MIFVHTLRHLTSPAATCTSFTTFDWTDDNSIALPCLSEKLRMTPSPMYIDSPYFRSLAWSLRLFTHSGNTYSWSQDSFVLLECLNDNEYVLLHLALRHSHSTRLDAVLRFAAVSPASEYAHWFRPRCSLITFEMSAIDLCIPMRRPLLQSWLCASASCQSIERSNNQKAVNAGSD